MSEKHKRVRADASIQPQIILAHSVILMCLVLLGILTACQPEVATTPPLVDETLTRPDLVGLIEWDRSPSTVVFRAQQTGAGDGFFSLGDIPDCTIYGDNSMVYLIPTDEGAPLVAVDRLPDESIRTLIEDLTLNYQLFNNTSGLTTLDPTLIPPVYETLSIAINGQTFMFDSLGGWKPDYYTRVVERCRAASLAPAEFVPESGAWITVRTVSYNPDQAARTWDVAATGVNLGDMSDKPAQWVRGAGAVALWDMLRAGSASIQLQQGEATYQVVMQVPGITPNSPAAP